MSSSVSELLGDVIARLLAGAIQADMQGAMDDMMARIKARENHAAAEGLEW